MDKSASWHQSDELDTVESRLWLAAVLFFGVGDVVTTGIGLDLTGVSEIGPLRSVVLRHGVFAVVGLKLVTFAACYVLWRAVPRPHAVGVPLGLALLGVPVTGWNVAVLVLAT
ncbi:hypothetical protein [Halorientalis litorea]|jgi:hypothetical protein|uniref:hypothetical protein n=1 Tax=Halorientalis litorea TaxID=2931977 RepID=UPI001FF6A40E|nr:hypothetical protein [Halorientalis litorea]